MLYKRRQKACLRAPIRGLRRVRHLRYVGENRLNKRLLMRFNHRYREWLRWLPPISDLFDSMAKDLLLESDRNFIKECFRANKWNYDPQAIPSI